MKLLAGNRTLIMAAACAALGAWRDAARPEGLSDGLLWLLLGLVGLVAGRNIGNELGLRRTPPGPPA
jgi:hypothetical protein